MKPDMSGTKCASHLVGCHGDFVCHVICDDFAIVIFFAQRPSYLTILVCFLHILTNSIHLQLLVYFLTQGPYHFCAGAWHLAPGRRQLCLAFPYWTHHLLMCWILQGLQLQLWTLKSPVCYCFGVVCGPMCGRLNMLWLHSQDFAGCDSLDSISQRCLNCVFLLALNTYLGMCETCLHFV